MSDFNLEDALSCSPERDNRCSDRMEVQEVQIEKLQISEELDPMVSSKKKTMRSAVNLVLVVNRLKKSPPHCDSELSDDELLSFIMDQVVKETIVEKNWNAPMNQGKVLFQRANSLRQCEVTDTSQKNFILDSSCDERQCKLLAITLQGGNNHRKVNFNMSRYVPELRDTSVDSSCVLLSIKDKNMHLSCSWEDDKAVLNLEECHDENLQSICQDTDMDRFLFIKKTTGYCLTTFESVKYREWFISTSSDASNHSVEMCKGSSSHCRRVCTFKVYSS